MVIFPVAGRHRPLASAKLYGLTIEAQDVKIGLLGSSTVLWIGICLTGPFHCSYSFAFMFVYFVFIFHAACCIIVTIIVI